MSISLSVRNYCASVLFLSSLAVPTQLALSQTPLPAYSVTTVAGTLSLSRVSGGGTDATADGTANDARFTSPTGIATNSSGTIYISEPSVNVIRFLQFGLLGTFAGTAGAVGYCLWDRDSGTFQQSLRVGR